MATIQDLKNWYERDLGRFSPWNNYVQVIADEGKCSPEEGVSESIDFIIYTDTNCFQIRARQDQDRDYLGCVSRSRRPRAGEDWQRGRDLHDGRLTEGTWHKILGEIVAYELVKVHKKPEEVVTFTEPVVAETD